MLVLSSGAMAWCSCRSQGAAAGFAGGAGGRQTTVGRSQTVRPEPPAA